MPRRATAEPRPIVAYTHLQPTEAVQAPDTQPGNYYVSAIEDNGYHLVMGPFVNDHAAALAHVDAVRAVSCDVDRRAVWMRFGTCRKAPGTGGLGLINKRADLLARVEGMVAAHSGESR